MEKIVYLEGSSRRGGNSDKMGSSFLRLYQREGDSVRKYILRDINFRECISCGGCDETGVCVLNDDLTPLYSDLETADTVIFVSPVYFNSVSARSKMCIDRMQAFWAKRAVLKEKNESPPKCIFLTDGGAPFYSDQFTGSALVMDYFFLAVGTGGYGMISVSDTDKTPFRITPSWKKIVKNFRENFQKNWYHIEGDNYVIK